MLSRGDFVNTDRSRRSFCRIAQNRDEDVANHIEEHFELRNAAPDLGLSTKVITSAADYSLDERNPRGGVNLY